MGSKFFGMGCAASFILGNNLDYAQHLAAWKAQGKLGSPPRSVFHWKQPAVSCIFCETEMHTFVRDLLKWDQEYICKCEQETFDLDHVL